MTAVPAISSQAWALITSLKTRFQSDLSFIRLSWTLPRRNNRLKPKVPNLPNTCVVEVEPDENRLVGS